MTPPLSRLSTHGAAYQDPIAAIDWNAADPAKLWLPAPLLSLSGLDIQAGMTRDVLLRFSQIEFARLCAAGLWLEGLMISRVTSNGFPATNVEEARVMLQEVREESGHGLMFLEMINRAGLSGIELLGPKKLLTWISHKLSPASPEFWALVFIGESVTDTLAVQALQLSHKYENAICPVARHVLLLHHRDEARHIAAARALLKTRAMKMSRARKAVFSHVLKYLLPQFMAATLYPTAASLRALGLNNAHTMARLAKSSPQRRRVAEACVAPALDALARLGLCPQNSDSASRPGNPAGATR